jgi:hypothetical protein
MAGPFRLSDWSVFGEGRGFRVVWLLGLAASMYFVVVSRNLAPEAERRNWGASKATLSRCYDFLLLGPSLLRSPSRAGACLRLTSRMDRLVSRT